MKIILNNKVDDVEENISIEQLLITKKIKNLYIAVEKNKEIVPKSKYNKCNLSEGDRIEIITAIGGG
tara:strand:- start:234 stop:434 length:201 start_codon:yes stop_codon:yes gene_type:complete